MEILFHIEAFHFILVLKANVIKEDSPPCFKATSESIAIIICFFCFYVLPHPMPTSNMSNCSGEFLFLRIYHACDAGIFNCSLR